MHTYTNLQAHRQIILSMNLSIIFSHFVVIAEAFQWKNNHFSLGSPSHRCFVRLFRLIFFFLHFYFLTQSFIALDAFCQMFMYVWNYVWILRCYSVDWLTITSNQLQHTIYIYVVYTTIFFFSVLDSMDTQKPFSFASFQLSGLHRFL